MQINQTMSFGPSRKPSTVRATVAGVGAAVIGGVAWYLIVRFTGYEVGWVAWGVGLAVGAAMARGTAVRGRPMAAQAGLTAALGLVLGKVLIFQWAAGPGLVTEIQADPELVRQVAFLEMYEAGEIPSDLEAQIMSFGEDEAWPDSVASRLDSLIDLKVAEMGDDGAALAAAGMAGDIRAEITFMDGLVASVSMFDLLWFFLAVGTAWKMLAFEDKEPIEPTPQEPEPTAA